MRFDEMNELARLQRELAENSPKYSDLASELLAEAISDPTDTGAILQDKVVCEARANEKRWQSRQPKPAPVPLPAKLDLNDQRALRQLTEDQLDQLANDGKISSAKLIAAKLEKRKLVFTDDDLPETLQARAVREQKEAAAKAAAEEEKRAERFFDRYMEIMNAKIDPKWISKP